MSQGTLDSDSFYIINLFQQGSYRSALSAYAALPSPSALLTLYAARSHLALTPPSPSSALSLLSSVSPPTLDSRALTSFAHYLSPGPESKKEEAVSALEEILAELGEGGLEEDAGGEGRFVRGVVGTVFVLEGEERREEGVEVLREAVELGHDQECLALLTHLYLSLSLPTLASSLLSSPSTKSFTSDSLLSQLLSARTSLALGPTAKYQEAYYVFEEIRGMQGGRSEGTLAGVAVAQAALGRWEEAAQAVNEALEMNPLHPTSLANQIALTLHSGKAAAVADSILATLQAEDPHHPLVVDLAHKEAEFEAAASKFKVANVNPVAVA